MKTSRLVADTRGAIVVEMAFAMPILIMIMIGIMQFALVMQASGAMRHAIGQGIRYAKVNQVSDYDDAAEIAALKSEVETIARASLNGVDKDGIQSLGFSVGTDSNGLDYVTLTMTYELQPLIPFVELPPIGLTETRTTYLPA